MASPPGTRRPTRIVRVAQGFLDPSSRPRYVAATRSRAEDRLPFLRPRCVVCGARARTRILTSIAAEPVTLPMVVCPDCGHVFNPTNTHDYRDYGDIGALKMKPRIGTMDRQGREFFMAEMAAEILGRDDLEVLVYSAGRSLDNVHIAALPQVRHVAISDIMPLRDDAEFLDSMQPAPRRFDIVVASEVVEHFLEPRTDVERLFGFVKPDGLLVCSTNLYDGGDIRRQSYIFTPGHTSYHTERSVRWLAEQNGLRSDVRTPLVATGYGGPRKRYLLFTGSTEVAAAIERYFEGRDYAPSDPPHPDASAWEAPRPEAPAAGAVEPSDQPSEELVR